MDARSIEVPILILERGVPAARPFPCRQPDGTEVAILCDPCPVAGTAVLDLADVPALPGRIRRTILECPSCHARFVALGTSARVRELVALELAARADPTD